MKTGAQKPPQKERKIMFEPWFYQNDCLRILQKVREKGNRRALAVVASGLGKTVIMAFDTLNFRKQFPKARVLYLCHQNQIISQSRGTFEVINGNTCTYGNYNGLERTAHSVDFLFASFQTMRMYMKKFSPDEFDYVVVDESHHIFGDTFIDVVNYWRPKFLLGMTATPDRTDKQDIRSVFGKEVFYLPLEEALSQSLLTPVDYRLMTDEIELNQVLQSSDQRLSMSRLNRTVFIPKRDEEIVRIIDKHRNEVLHPSTIIFCQSIAYCEHLARYVKDSMIVHSRIPLTERVVRTEMFRQGLVSTLLVVDVFNEGIDIPQANLIVFLRLTTSPLVFYQQLGRGLRLCEGKEKVIVLDFVGNCERVKTVCELWERVKHLRESKRVQKIVAQHKPIRTRVSIEPFIIDTKHISFKEKILVLVDLVNRINAEFYSTWQEAATAAIKLGATKSRDYQKLYKQDPRLPFSPSYVYRSTWPGWDRFFGKDAYPTWQEASIAALKLGLKTRRDYLKGYVKDQRLVCNLYLTYKDFPGWNAFLGIPRRAYYPTLHEASVAAIALGAKTKDQYKLLYKQDALLHSQPNRKYHDFTSWPAFLGTKK